MFKDMDVIITGIGSWSIECIKQLLEKDVNSITLLSRHELTQVEVKRNFKNNPKLIFKIADIRDYEGILPHFRNKQFCFNFAALKHIDIAENQPIEAIKTNIFGTMNVIKACQHHFVKKCMLASTDKAANPFNTYGMTKAISEKLWLQANDGRKDYESRFVVVRAGNVFCSNGSAVPFFINQIKTTNIVTLTDEDMNRFFIKIPDIIKFTIDCMEKYENCICVPKMKSMLIKDLITVLIEKYGDETTTVVKIIGKKEGEKLTELLISSHEMETTLFAGNMLDKNKSFYIIFRNKLQRDIETRNIQDENNICFKPKILEYKSDMDLMTKEEIKEFLRGE